MHDPRIESVPLRPDGRDGAATVLRALAGSLWAQPWLVLGLMAFLAGGNGVAARIATHQVPPLLLVVLRWAIVSATLSLLFKRDQWRELRTLVRHHWFQLGWMGLVGFTGFNALFYVCAYHTTAVNLTLLQSAIPALVLAGAGLIFKVRIRARQIVGMGLTFLGVLVVAAKGDLARLAALRLDLADVGVLVCSLFYAAFALGLRARPPGSALVFFAGMSFAALLFSLPLGAVELAMGDAYWPSAAGWETTLFIAFGPSFIGQLCFMRGVQLIGPARAGLSANLIPVTGALCAVLVLHEPFTLADATALALGLGGISLAEWGGPRRRDTSDERAGAARDPGLP